MSRGHILGATGGFLVSRAALGGNSSGQIGALSAVAINEDFGSGPPHATPCTLTLTQTGGTFGYGRVEVSGDTSAFELVSIEGQTLGPAVRLDDAGIDNLLAVAWGNGVTDPSSVALTFGVVSGIASTSYNCTLSVRDMEGDEVYNFDLAAVVDAADDFRDAVMTLNATYLYSPAYIDVGDLSDGETSMEDLLNAGPPAEVQSLAVGPTIADSTLTWPSLTKLLAAKASMDHSEGNKPDHLYGAIPSVGTTASIFMVVTATDPGSTDKEFLQIDDHLNAGGRYSRSMRMRNLHWSNPYFQYFKDDPDDGHGGGGGPQIYWVSRVTNYWTLGLVLDGTGGAKIILGNVGGTQSGFNSGALGSITAGAIKIGLKDTNASNPIFGIAAIAVFPSELTEANFNTLHAAVS